MGGDRVANEGVSGLCKDCRFWLDEGRDGECHLHSVSLELEKSKVTLLPEQGANEAWMYTAPDFGCNQFEAKE